MTAPVYPTLDVLHRREVAEVTLMVTGRAGVSMNRWIYRMAGTMTVR